jgi:hypothetical protein
MTQQLAKIFADKVEIYDNGELAVIFNPTETPEFGPSPMDSFQASVDAGNIIITEHYSNPTYAKNYQKKLLAAKRYEVEIGGTTWNGHHVDTDRFSQGKITAAFVLAINTMWPDGSVWKFNDGVAVPMLTADILSLTTAIQTHVQGAFNTEAIKIAEIDATGVTDIEAGW